MDTRRFPASSERAGTIECDEVPLGDRCVAPLPDGWLVRTADGLIEITHDGTRRSHAAVELAPEEWTNREKLHQPGLHTSPDGRFAAVVTEYGNKGAVVDLRTDEVVLWLDRDFADAWITPHPIVFAGSGEDTLVVVATDWNRLDVFEAASGRLLTDRDVEHGSPNYLDYFHGALALSPSGRWLYDDGWVWQPWGVRTVIDLEAWLVGEVYAAEHAAEVGVRDERDHPMVWLDDETVAVQRLGTSWEHMLDGVQIIDVPTRRMLQMIAGPAGRMWDPRRAAGSLLGRGGHRDVVRRGPGFYVLVLDGRGHQVGELVGGARERRDAHRRQGGRVVVVVGRGAVVAQGQ